MEHPLWQDPEVQASLEECCKLPTFPSLQGNRFFEAQWKQKVRDVLLEDSVDSDIAYKYQTEADLLDMAKKESELKLRRRSKPPARHWQAV